MDKVIKSGEYTLTRIDKDSFHDFIIASDSENVRATFERLLSIESWFATYLIRYQGEIIGYRQVKTINKWFYEIGVYIRESARNFGHGAATANIIIEYLANEKSAKRIQAVVSVTNVASNNMIKNTRFKYEATLKNYTVDENHDPQDANIYSVTF